ncbi:MAG: hypothetical protein M3P33_03205 [bacterium]|nr:hypothetical protein [bacterium]
MIKKISLIVLIALGYFYYLSEVDQQILWANKDIPLEQGQTYIIQPNEEVICSNGTVCNEGGYVYTIIKSDKQQLLEMPGRIIGSSKVQIDQYVHKPVHITGSFRRGKPLLIKNENVPEFFTYDLVVLDIESVILAE